MNTLLCVYYVFVGVWVWILLPGVYLAIYRPNILFFHYRLLDTLPPHLQNSNLIPPKQLDELPDDITLAQTVATWKYIVHFQDKLRQK